jgi:hypothetical protein
MSELRRDEYEDNEQAPGKDLPAEGQIAASIGKILSKPDRYLEWARIAREESRDRFPQTYARITPEELETFYKRYRPQNESEAGIRPEEITD